MTRLAVVRVGAFSGSGVSLRDALAEKVEILDFDFMPQARRPVLWLPRLLAKLEAGAARDSVPVSKTAAWSRGLQRVLPSELQTVPMLFIQSTSALGLPAGTRYGIYTDRLGREGGEAEGEFRSRATSGWVEREQRFVANAHRLFVMGPTTGRYAVDHYGVAPDRVSVVGGAPNARLGPHRQSEECRRLLFVGIEWRRKGLADLFEAFETVRHNHPELALDVVGAEPDLRMPLGVNVFGRVPHGRMAEFYARADLVVIPTYTEPFGIALVEALMMGIPVIGSTVGNQEWIIGGGGLAVPPGRPDALAAAIVAMVEDYPSMKARADARRSQLLSTMTWERIAERILAELLEDDGAGQ